MKKFAVYSIAALSLATAMLLTTGCFGTSKPSMFYLLGPLPESTQAPSEIGRAGMVSLVIGPVSLPAYLDRPNIVARTDKNELAVAEFSRWAEPLKDNFFRILIENLSMLLDTVNISVYPQRISQAYDYQIVIDVTRFDTDAAGGAELTAFWFVTGENDGKILLRKRSVLHVDAAGRDQNARVAALNRLLSDFSRDIADEIGKLR
jgi:uncharacterized lipoprotein YmbA